MHPLKYIGENLTTKELLCQLAEECSELSKAALKLRRTLSPCNNPTPVTYEEAISNFKEEVADIKLVLLVLDVKFDDSDIESICRRKTQRWANRLEDNKCSMIER